MKSLCDGFTLLIMFEEKTHFIIFSDTLLNISYSNMRSILLSLKLILQIGLMMWQGMN